MVWQFDKKFPKTIEECEKIKGKNHCNMPAGSACGCVICEDCGYFKSCYGIIDVFEGLKRIQYSYIKANEFINGAGI